MLRLSVVPPTGDGFVHRSAGGSFVVGRSTRADLVLPDAALSRRHARFFEDDTRWMVEDLGSRNGTTVNGRLVNAPTRVRPGDLVLLGGSRIQVLATEARSSEPSSTGDGAPGSGARSSTELFRRALTPPPSDAEMLTRYRERLRILNDVHAALAASISVDELLDLVLDRVFNHLLPHQGAIFLRDSRGQVYQARGRAVPGHDQSFPHSETLWRRVTEEGIPTLVADTRADNPLASSDSVRRAGIQSLLAVPMLGLDETDEVLGMIALATSSEARRFDDSDLELLLSLASVAAMRLTSVFLAERAAERRRLARELAVARQIQIDLLPKELPRIEGWELFGRSLPSSVVSGDYYSLTRLRDGKCVLLIVDVSGKGIGASLLMGYVEAHLSCYLDEGLPPDAIMERVSRRLHQRTLPEIFATAVLGLLDPQHDVLTYASAGHHPILVVRASGGVVRAPSTGLPLGLFPDAAYATERLQIAPGDLAVMFTDGLIEAESREGIDYGIDRLVEVCSTHRRLGLPQLAEELEQDFERFVRPNSTGDDRTLVMARRLDEG